MLEDALDVSIFKITPLSGNVVAGEDDNAPVVVGRCIEGREPLGAGDLHLSHLWRGQNSNLHGKWKRLKSIITVPAVTSPTGINCENSFRPLERARDFDFNSVSTSVSNAEPRSESGVGMNVTTSVAGPLLEADFVSHVSPVSDSLQAGRPS